MATRGTWDVFQQRSQHVFPAAPKKASSVPGLPRRYRAGPEQRKAQESRTPEQRATYDHFRMGGMKDAIAATRGTGAAASDRFVIFAAGATPPAAEVRAHNCVLAAIHSALDL